MVMEFVRGETLDKLCERVGRSRRTRSLCHRSDPLRARTRASRRRRPSRRQARKRHGHRGRRDKNHGLRHRSRPRRRAENHRLPADGTPAYISPEQVLGEEVDGRSDLYSVGVLFYRLLSGALPFAADTALGMLQRQIRDTPIPLCAHRGGLPDWCEAIVQKALAKTQSDRFQSAEEFREALSRATGPLPMADIAKTFAAEGRESLVLWAPIVTETLDLSQQRPVGPLSFAPAPPIVIPPAPRSEARHDVGRRRQLGVLVFGVIALRCTSCCAAMRRKRQTNPHPLPVVQPAIAETQAATVCTACRERSQTTRPRARTRDRLKPVDRRRLNRRQRSQGSAAHTWREPRRCPLGIVSWSDAPLRRSRRRNQSSVGLCADRRRNSILVFETLRARRHAQVEGAGRTAPDGRRQDHDHSHFRSSVSVVCSRTVACLRSTSRAVAIRCGARRRDRHRRAGGTLSKIGTRCSRDWIALRTSTEEQFVRCASMKCAEACPPRIEERTGHQSQFIELPERRTDASVSRVQKAPTIRPRPGAETHYSSTLSKSQRVTSAPDAIPAYGL